MTAFDGRTRPASRTLTRAGVVQAARELVQETGVESLTMRRLADRCGVGTMTLYRHMRTKEELLQALANTYFEEIEFPSATPGDGVPPWDQRVATVFREVRRIYLKYPELATIAATQPVDGAVAFRGAEVVLACLAEAGIGGSRATAAFDALSLFTLGFAQREAAEMNAPGTRAGRASRMLALPPDQFPHVRAVASEMLDRVAATHFDEGIELILDGLRNGRSVVRRG
jgi:AcrR family transcriptional regulator